MNPENQFPAHLQIIPLPLPFRMGSVNCYLIETDSGYTLIDTGGSNNRKALSEALLQAGCLPGRLNLILLTHGDFDHTGNATNLRRTFGGKIAMHTADAKMGESGDMFANRRQPNFLIRLLVPLFTGFGKAERFSPDVLLEDGQDLAPYGLEARVIAVPGHSKGSIAIQAGDSLFCGDLLENIKKPALTNLVDDLHAAQVSLQRLAQIQAVTVYPGHGKPFAAEWISLCSTTVKPRN
ncbi:MAG TPA: MBL fold metallo-hydrolase [Anaerolineaceae bacterium]